MCVTVANFIKIGRTVAEIWHFFKMASVRLLGFCWARVWTTNEDYFWNRCSTFDNYESFNIFCVWLQNAYSRPKIVFLGGFDSHGSNINVTTKRH